MERWKLRQVDDTLDRGCACPDREPYKGYSYRDTVVQYRTVLAAKRLRQTTTVNSP